MWKIFLVILVISTGCGSIRIDWDFNRAKYLSKMGFPDSPEECPVGLVHAAVWRGDLETTGAYLEGWGALVNRIADPISFNRLAHPGVFDISSTSDLLAVEIPVIVREDVVSRPDTILEDLKPEVADLLLPPELITDWEEDGAGRDPHDPDDPDDALFPVWIASDFLGLQIAPTHQPILGPVSIEFRLLTSPWLFDIHLRLIPGSGKLEPVGKEVSCGYLPNQRQ